MVVVMALRIQWLMLLLPLLLTTAFSSSFDVILIASSDNFERRFICNKPKFLWWATIIFDLPLLLSVFITRFHSFIHFIRLINCKEKITTKQKIKSLSCVKCHSMGNSLAIFIYIVGYATVCTATVAFIIIGSKRCWIIIFDN